MAFEVGIFLSKFLNLSNIELLLSRKSPKKNCSQTKKSDWQSRSLSPFQHLRLKCFGLFGRNAQLFKSAPLHNYIRRSTIINSHFLTSWETREKVRVWEITGKNYVGWPLKTPYCKLLNSMKFRDRHGKSLKLKGLYIFILC